SVPGIAGGFSLTLARRYPAVGVGLGCLPRQPDDLQLDALDTPALGRAAQLPLVAPAIVEMLVRAAEVHHAGDPGIVAHRCAIAVEINFEIAEKVLEAFEADEVLGAPCAHPPPACVIAEREFAAPVLGEALFPLGPAAGIECLDIAIEQLGDRRAVLELA